MEAQTVLFLALLYTGTGLGAQVKPASKPANTTKGPAIDDRINLSFNRAHSHAYGPGGVSDTDAVSQGVQVGIRRPGQLDVPLYQKNDAYGRTNAYGAAPPTTWAGANNNQDPYGSRGGAEAGYAGGNGYTETLSQNQHIEIPLDAFGTVLYSNLKGKKRPEAGAKPAKADRLQL